MPGTATPEQGIMQEECRICILNLRILGLVIG